MKKWVEGIGIVIGAILLVAILLNMSNTSKKIWFQGTIEIQTDLKTIENSLDHLDETFVGIVSKIPGITSVQLIKKDVDFITLKTNEGLMKRTRITSLIEPDKIILEFDEEYQAGKTMKSTSHYRHVYVSTTDKIIHTMTISRLETTGFAGFFYRNFGSSNMGKAFLNAHQSYFEGKE